jgi:hypothetical protein
MIYIIISNVGLAIMMLIVYARYSKFRLSSASEIKELRNRIDVTVEERKIIEEKLLVETKTDTQKIEVLLREIDELRKDKESEVRLRLEAEKQIELALQKTEEIQKRMSDWRVVQDAVMKDSKEAIIKVGNDLYKKLNESYKNEVETNKNLLGRVSKNITDFFEKAVVEKPKTPAKAAPVKAAPPITHAHENVAKKLISDLVETMKASGQMANKEYFLPANFDEQKAKLLFCEVAFINLDKLHILDFKACQYLEEYRHNSDKTAAAQILKQRLDKYLAYLGNPKYRESILKVLSSTKAKFDKSEIIIVLPSKDDLRTVKEIHYYDKARKIVADVMDADEINNLIL